MRKEHGRPESAVAAPAAVPDGVTVERFRRDLQRLTGDRSGTLLVAVSGGADSLSLLLLALAALGGEVRAATVDHGLRPEAAGEAAFVAEVCRTLGVPHTTLAGSVPDRTGGTANLQNRARALRYELLEAHRVSNGCRWIATAHHADDQLETMLMRLNRGSGISGLAGVRATNGNILRPLLGWRRSDLARLVADAGLAPVLDPGNVDERFDRARLRNALTGAEWPNAARWTASAAALAEAEEALAWLADRLGDERIADRGTSVVLSVGSEPPEVVRRLVTRCLLQVEPGAALRGGEVRRLADRIVSVLESGRPMRATLAGVAIASGREAGRIAVTFSPAPPRRSPT